MAYWRSGLGQTGAPQAEHRSYASHVMEADCEHIARRAILDYYVTQNCRVEWIDVKPIVS